MDTLNLFERILNLFLDKDGNMNLGKIIFVIIMLILASSIIVSIPVLHGRYLPAPNQPELIYPREEQKVVEILPTFYWKGGNDESQISLLLSQININLTNLLRLNPVIEYSIYLSDNKTEIEANCAGSCQGNESSLPVYSPIKQKLEANTTYYWKVVADNNNRFNKCISESSIRTFKTRPKPFIFFKPNKTVIEISPGENVNLSWNVLNAENVSLYETREYSEVLKGNYSANDGRTVAPENTTDYRLYAYNDAGTDSHNIQIFVKKLNPEIVYFSALNSSSDFKDNITYINIGENITLEWFTQNADSAWLIPDCDKHFYVKDSYKVAPNEDCTYTLFAKNKNGIVNRTVHVYIVRS